jgi:hypothetical protein
MNNILGSNDERGLAVFREEYLQIDEGVGIQQKETNLLKARKAFALSRAAEKIGIIFPDVAIQ